MSVNCSRYELAFTFQRRGRGKSWAACHLLFVKQDEVAVHPVPIDGKSVLYGLYLVSDYVSHIS